MNFNLTYSRIIEHNLVLSNYTENIAVWLLVCELVGWLGVDHHVSYILLLFTVINIHHVNLYVMYILIY